jgi:hypothetical protein
MESIPQKPETENKDGLSLKAKGALIAIFLSLGIAVIVPFIDLSDKKPTTEPPVYFSNQPSAEKPLDKPSASTPSPTPNPTIGGQSEISDLGRQLASIDANENLELSDPRSVTYEALLISLKNKTGTEKQKIADYTVNMRDLLKEKGISVTLLFILSQVNKMARKELNQSYETYTILLGATLVDEKERKTSSYGSHRGAVAAA